jgi:DNA-directed RNA polymerase subunit omega
LDFVARGASSTGTLLDAIRNTPERLIIAAFYYPKLGLAFGCESVILLGSFLMNAELAKKAAEKVGNPNVLINLISRRVRQLNSGGGGLSRPLVDNATNLGVADIALREIIEEKIGWDMPEITELVRPQPRKRKKR